MKKSRAKKGVEAGVQLSLFVDQTTTVDERGKKIEPTILDKILKTKKDTRDECVYKDTYKEFAEGCYIAKYIHENNTSSILLPDIALCGPKCPYFTKNKQEQTEVT